MELILISDSKLKIMLSQKDMSKYSLNLEDIDYDNTETRRAFWNILDEAKHKTGFDAAREKVYIQVFPCRAGGCEIFVTRLDESGGSTALNLEVRESSSDCEIYTFDGITELLAVCDILCRRNYTGNSSVYADDMRYYLVLGSTRHAKYSIGEYSFIEDYAVRRENKNYIYYIREHCSEICINEAVKTLAPLR